MQHRNAHTAPWRVLVLREHDSVWAPEAKPQVLAAAEAIHNGLRDAGYEVIPLPLEPPFALPSVLQRFKPGQYIVLNWFEGVEVGAEDAIQVAALLEELGHTYTGADIFTLRTTQDRIRTNRVLTAHNIPTPEWQAIRGDHVQGWNHYPAIIKIANEHGSTCLTAESVVHDEPSLRRRATELRAEGFQDLIVSEFIAGREFTVSIWGNGNLQYLPLLEFDYSAYPPSVPPMRSLAAKWETDSHEYQNTRLVCPQDLSPDLQSHIERVAHDTYSAFHLRDFGRIDIRLRGDVPCVIDVNSNPDITGDGSFTLAAQQAGYTYSAMLDHIVQLAIHRMESRL